VADIELKIRPGMVTLTWTSMNIDTYKAHVHAGLNKLSQLLSNVNDIVENRIEKNLKMVTRTLLVNLPKNESLALDEFVIKQEHHVRDYKVQLQAKNREIEHAVDNIIDLATKYVLDVHIEPVQVVETTRVRTHYNKMMYTALLNCTRNSLLALKKRICARAGSGFLFLERPFFEVDVQLAVPSVRLSPSLEDIQRAVNKGALAVLRVSKSIWLWGQGEVNEDTATSEELLGRRSFFDQIGKDVEIVKGR
jgi:dynein heavy chain